ncbi:MAG: XylR N-terminal domain-containing protein [Bacillales bacterium]|nr:XylR N-terminal domain-containing protein [Bacillales bacterium]
MNVEKTILEKLKLKLKNDLLYMGDNRSIIVTTKSFSSLRKDLIQNIGLERMKGYFFRHGWELGKEDAKELKKHADHSLEEIIQYGPFLHSMKGHVEAKTLHLQVKDENGQKFIVMEGIWKNSFEAEDHVRLFGPSKYPVCFTLTGYASGYVSEVVGEMVLFKEISCLGTGEKECRWIGKTLSQWGKESKEMQQYLNEPPIVKELELTYEKLLEERNQLTFATKVHNELTKEIMRGHGLESIIHKVYELVGIPIVLENLSFQPLAHEGLSPESLESTSRDFCQYVKDHYHGNSPIDFHQTTKLISFHHYFRLMAPVLLHDQVFGYCSFIFYDRNQYNPTIAQMVIERVASVCSLRLLNEKTKFESFERLKGYFLEEIISGQYQSREDFITKGSFIHLDLSRPFYISVIKYRFKNEQSNLELEYYAKIMEEISEFFSSRRLNVLIGQRAKSIVLLITEEQLKNNDIEEFVRLLLKSLSKKFAIVEFFGGISSKTKDILESREAYREALVALKTATNHNRLVSFESLGVIGPLINTHNEKEVKKIAARYLGQLMENDAKNVELVRTLYAFLVNGGNLEQTAADLALSVSGLRYRIHKIETLLGKELRNPVVNFHLLLAIQALMIVGELDI